MIYAIFIALVLTLFLLVLNGYLEGTRKNQTDAILGGLIIGLLIAAFLVADWKIGFLVIAVAFILSRITPPLAARLASRILATSSDRGGIYVGLPPRPLQKISLELGKPLNPEKLAREILGHGNEMASAEDALLDYCEQQAPIQTLLKEFDISRNDLNELYRDLIRLGCGQWACGHWVAASALAYPESLRYVLNRRDRDRVKTANHLLQHFRCGSTLET